MTRRRGFANPLYALSTVGSTPIGFRAASECAISVDIEGLEAAVSGGPSRELLANLLKRRDELRLESEALDKLIDTYQRLALLEKQKDADQLDLWKGGQSRRARSAYVAELLAEARRMILGEGRPLTRSELLRRLESEGYVIEGADKSKVLGTNIWRSGQFEHIAGKGYWPKDTPLPKG